MAVNTLERVVETLGPGVIAVLGAPRGLDIEVHDVLIHDPLDRFEVAGGDLVLGVGLAPGPATIALIGELAPLGVAGLVVKAPADDDTTAVQAAEEHGLTLLSVPMGASWAQIVQLLQSVLAHGASAMEDLHGLAASDLFSLADAIAELIDAPVTIEDRLSRVLAYSGRQNEADAGRAETIIGRRVPDRYVRELEKRGVFKRLAEERSCVYVDEIGPDLLPRLAVSVRVGNEVLGSIWAAVASRPPADVEKAFADTAKVAALHLLRHRAEADVERTVQADLLATILHGTGGAREAALRLGVDKSSYRVLAVWLAADDEAAATRARTQLRDVVAVQLAAFRLRGAAALLGGIVYALIATDDDPERSRDLAVRIAEDLTGRPAHLGAPSIGIGGHASSLTDVPRSKLEAEETLRVLRTDRDGRVATIDEVRLAALLARFSEAAEPELKIYERQLEPLIDSDRQGQTDYIASIRAFLEEFGDYTAAAARLHVHPNTLRYRLQRAQKLSGISIDDPDDRLALLLLLRLLPPA